MEYSLLLLQIAIMALLHSQKTEARHNYLLCNRLKTSCDKYENYCNQERETKIENSTNSSNNETETGKFNEHKMKVWPGCCNLARSTDSLATSGVYYIESPFGGFSLTQAYCDLHAKNGGWTVIQRRTINGTESFNRSWHEYVNGFGSLEGEFWYGLSKIKWLTNQDDTIYELKVDVTTHNGENKTAEYSSFSLTGDLFTLSLGEHKAGVDFLTSFNGRSFSTRDSNNAGTVQNNCALVDDSSLLGGWWYTRTCLGDMAVNPNGKFTSSYQSSELRNIINSTEMKIRPIGCTAETRKGSSSVH